MNDYIADLMQCVPGPACSFHNICFICILNWSINTKLSLFSFHWISYSTVYWSTNACRLLFWILQTFIPLNLSLFHIQPGHSLLIRFYIRHLKHFSFLFFYFPNVEIWLSFKRFSYILQCCIPMCFNFNNSLLAYAFLIFTFSRLLPGSFYSLNTLALY